MSIKLTLLKSGETLISEMKELVAEDTEQAHAYLLENPHKVETREKSFLTEDEKKTGDFGIDVILIPWIILSADKKVIIPRSDFIFKKDDRVVFIVKKESISFVENIFRLSSI